MNETAERIAEAAKLFDSADYIVVAAGAGMGVDSGLPDFRGAEGFWRAYPTLRGIRFEEMSNPEWFDRDPSRAWGFFGHRLELYRKTKPHVGFEVLLRQSRRADERCFVVTSNVDGQFQIAGFEDYQMFEVHGTIHRLQCAGPCGRTIWPYDEWQPQIDEAEVRCLNELPRCIHCSGLARPNILMFDDGRWLARRTEKQAKEFQNWLDRASGKKVVAVELGAGTAVATIRRITESLQVPLIRINTLESAGPSGTISIPLGAADALQRIDAVLEL